MILVFFRRKGMKRFNNVKMGNFSLLITMITILALAVACVMPNGMDRAGSEGAEGLAVPDTVIATAMSPDSIFLAWDEVPGI
jgi:hypothetical protein